MAGTKEGFSRREFLGLTLAGGITFCVPTIIIRGNTPSEIYLTSSDSIQEAINRASDGSKIILGDGVYKGDGNRNLHWEGKHLHILSEDGPANCVIHPEDKGRGFVLDKDQNRRDIIQGLTITRGKAETDERDYGSGDYAGGGGIWTKGTSPIIMECDLFDNFAFSSLEGWLADGGAVCGSHGSSPLLLRSRIRDNHTTHAGGGVAFLDSNGLVVGCEISGNKPQGCDGGAGVLIRGGMRVYGSPKDKIGRYVSGAVVNSLIYRNRTTYYSKNGGYGVGLSLVNARAAVIGNDFILNDGELDPEHPGSGIGARMVGLSQDLNYSEFLNNLFFQNLGGEEGKKDLYVLVGRSDTFPVSYNFFHQETPANYEQFSGPGNVIGSDNPGFVGDLSNPELVTAEDLRLRGDSSLIGKGKNLYLKLVEAGVPDSEARKDFAGRLRPLEGPWTIGAYEAGPNSARHWMRYQ